MLDMFNRDLDTSSVFINPLLTKVASRQKSKLDAVIDFYKNQEIGFVNNNNFILKFFNSIPNYSGSIEPLKFERYWDIIDESAKDYGLIFNITTATNYGVPNKPSIFFKKQNLEWFILDENKVDIEHFLDNWENYSPLRFIKHPKLHLNANYYPLGDPSKEEGNIVVLVNFSMLACQRELWFKKYDTEKIRSNRSFYNRWVLPMSLYSFQDIAWFNLILACYYNRLVLEPENTHRFKFYSGLGYSTFLIKNFLTFQKRKCLSFELLLNSMPAIYNKTLKDTLALPDLMAVKSNLIVTLLARLELFRWFIDWDIETGSTKQRDLANRLYRDLKNYANNKFPLSIGNIEVAQYLNTELNLLVQDLNQIR